jgi:hypothetical protein
MFWFRCEWHFESHFTVDTTACSQVALADGRPLIMAPFAVQHAGLGNAQFVTGGIVALAYRCVDLIICYIMALLCVCVCVCDGETESVCMCVCVSLCVREREHK